SDRGATTDERGRFELRVSPGSLYVSVALNGVEKKELGLSDSGDPCCSRALTIAPGESSEVVLAMGGSSVRLHGRIEGLTPELLFARAWDRSSSSLRARLEG